MAKMRLDKLLKSSRYNQKDVSDYTGINKNTISKYVNNTFEKIDKGHLDLICDLFKCTLNDLFELEPVQQKLFPPSEIGNWMDISNTNAVGHEYNKKPLSNKYTLKIFDIPKEEHKSGLFLGRKSNEDDEVLQKYGYDRMSNDEEIVEMQLQQDRLDLEYDFELGVDELLDRIIDTYDPTIQEQYKELIKTYSDNKDFPLSFKLTSLYRVIYRLLSVQSDSGLRSFITQLRKIYMSGDLVDLTDEELINLSNISNYYLNLLNNKQKD